MSATSRTLRNATTVWVDSTRPSWNANDPKQLTIGGSVAYAYLYFPLTGIPASANITTATLRVYASATWGGSPTLTVERISQEWKAGQVTWDTAPNVVTASAVALATSSPVNGTELAFDVTSMLQTVVGGTSPAPWYGVRLRSGTATLRKLWAASALDYKPTLTVTWSAAPAQPTVLSPSGERAVSVNKPTLRFDFTDDIGSTALQSAQVQMNSTATWADPSFDSGPVVTTTPELDLNAYTYARTVSVTKTAGSATITAAAAALTAADIGATITGTGIPAATTITAASSGSTTSTMSTGTGVTAGTVTATITRTYPGITAGTSTFWRVRVQDTAGLWSPWSDAARFTRINKSTLTITNPAVTPAVVKEWTPPLAWTFTGTQTAWQVLIVDPTDPTDEFYDSGRVRGSALSHTLPKKVLTKDGKTYRLIVRVWDDKDREHTPGDRVYNEAVRDFTFAEDATVSPVTGLTAVQVGYAPWVQLNFSRATAPDSFTVKRDGEIVDNELLAADLLVSGTAYRYTDRDAKPNRSHTWVVQAVVNKVTSASNPSATFTPVPLGVWLYDPDRDVEVFLANPPGSRDPGTWGMGETGETLVPLGASRPVRIIQSVRGWEGSITGMLIDANGKTAQQWQDQLFKLKERPTQPVTLSVGTESFKVILSNIATAPIGPIPGTRAASFDFFQVGNLAYTPKGF